MMTLFETLKIFKMSRMCKNLAHAECVDIKFQIREK